MPQVPIKAMNKQLPESLKENEILEAIGPGAPNPLEAFMGYIKHMAGTMDEPEGGLPPEEQVQAELDKHGAYELYKKLGGIDPLAYATGTLDIFKGVGKAVAKTGKELVKGTKKGIAPSSEPVLIRSRPVNDIIYLEFDTGVGRMPSVKEIEKYIADKGFQATVIGFEPNLISGIRGTRRFRLDVTKGGNASSEAAKELSEHFGGSFQAQSSRLKKEGYK